MSEFIVSARKYRPSTFKTVVGQEIITTTLKNSIKNKHLAHSYLFCGPRGVGKTTCARIFAKAINCFHPTEDFEPCNQCESCINFNKNALFNIHELDAASNNSVDSIRELINQVRIPPQLGKYSVFIIDEVHMLSKDAFNAFLKTLEEPPSHAIFIMATTEKHKIIPTILSRCQIFDFRRIQLSDIVHQLEYIAQQEDIHAEHQALITIAQKADGSMRDALSIFDQMNSFCENELTYEKVIRNLNVLDYEYYFRLTQAFLNGNAPETLLIFNEILFNGFDAQYFIMGLGEHFRNLMLCKDKNTIPLLEVSENVSTRYAQQSMQCTDEFLFEALQITNDTEQQYRTSYNKRFLVELMLYKISNIQKQKNSASTPLSTNESKEPSSVTSKEYSKQTDVNQNSVSEPVAKTSINNENSTSTASSNNPVTHLSSFSIKQKLQQNLEIKSKINPVSQEINAEKDFTLEMAQQAWNAFLNHKLNDVRLKNFFTQYPQYVYWDDKTCVLKVLNKSQELDLRKIHDELLFFLKQTLQNKNIIIKIELTDEEIKTIKPYTSKEKYAYFIQKYPALGEIKEQLDLDFQ